MAGASVLVTFRPAAGGPLRQALCLALVVGVWLVVRVLQVYFLGWGSGSDVTLYMLYAQHWVAAPGAYANAEYPPGAVPVFLLPWLVGGTAHYARSFALMMAGFDLAACLLVLRCAEIGGRRWPRVMAAPLLYLTITAALYPVLYARFDLVPAALVLGAMYCMHRGRIHTSALILGAAGAVKLWPFVFVPLWLARVRHQGIRRVAGVAGGIVVGALIAALPVLPRAGWQGFSFVRFHASRGIQIETTWAALALVLNEAGLAAVRPEHYSGAFHVVGTLPAIFAILSPPVMAVAALMPQGLLMMRGKDALPQRRFGYAVLGSVIGFMVGANVLSPQFMLWIAPLLALAVEGAAGVAAAFALAALTTAIYPYLDPALEQRAPGHRWALAALVARNVLLIGWYYLTLSRLWRPHEDRLHENN